MQTTGTVCMLLIGAVLLAGCTQLPDYHTISDTPDPISGQWIGGEPPASELHVVFYDNHTFLSVSSFINREMVTDTGSWTKIERASYSAQSVTGTITNWTYDPFNDVVYVTGLPQQDYHRYKG